MMTSMCHLQDIFGLSRGSDLILKVVVLLSLFLWVEPEVRTWNHASEIFSRNLDLVEAPMHIGVETIAE